MRDDYLVLDKLCKEFGSGKGTFLAVDSVDLKVREGELVTLLGPSGCGKTTTLRMISGFQVPTSGEIRIDGERMEWVPPNKRPTAMVFQNYALFPHLSVFENIAYGLKVHRNSRSEIERKTKDIMELVGLEGLSRRSPEELSGGQQQRVSLARSLVMEPKVLLLDEPLSNLDAKLRVSTRMEIRKLQQRLGITTVYVTHDQEEAMTLSDRVVIMYNGRIQQVGRPREIYARPVNRFVAGFIGKANFVEARVAVSRPDAADVTIAGRRVTVPTPQRGFEVDERVLVVARPESIVVGPPTEGSMRGKITEAVYLGSEILYSVAVGELSLSAEQADPEELEVYDVGAEVGVTLRERNLHLLPYED